MGVPVVTSNGIANQVVNQIPSNNATGNQNTTPFGVAGTYDGETRPFRLASGLTVTYTWYHITRCNHPNIVVSPTISVNFPS